MAVTPAKVLRISLKVLLWILVLVLVLLMGIFIFLRTPAGQRFLTQQVEDILNEEIGPGVEIGLIKLKLPGGLELQNVRIPDHRGNTMMDIGRLDLSLPRYLSQQNENIVRVARADLSDVTWNLTQYPGDTITNFTVMMERLSSDEPKEDAKDIVLRFGRLTLTNINFIYDQMNQPYGEHGIDWDHLAIRNGSGTLYDVEIWGTDIEGTVRNLSLTEERSGFRLEDLRTRFTMKGDTLMRAENLYLRTPHTVIRDYLAFNYRGLGAFSHFEDSVFMEAHLERSTVSLRDLNYFTDALENKTDSVTLTADVFGPVSNMRLQRLDARFGRYSRLYGEAHLRGLPNVDSTYISARLRESATSAAELTRLLPEIPLPEEIDRLGRVSLDVSYAGYFNDFSTLGTINTGLGTVIADLHLKLPENTDHSSYRGQVELQNFDLGTLLGQDDLGHFTVNARVAGKGFSIEALDAKFDAYVTQARIMGYNYQNVNVAGDMRRKLFTGELLARDPNANLDFAGTVNFNPQKPEFNFVSTIRNIRLHKLGFTTDTLELAAIVNIDMAGLDPEEMEGTVSAQALTLTAGSREIHLDSLYARARLDTGNYRHYHIESEILRADVSGRFTLAKADDIVFDAINTYIDSSFLRFHAEPAPGEFMAFDVRYHQADSFLKVFLPDMGLPDSGFVRGVVSAKGRVELEGYMPEVSYKNWRAQQIMLDGQNVGDVLALRLVMAAVRQKDSMLIRDFELYTQTNNDHVTFVLGSSDSTGENRALLRGTFDVVEDHAHLVIDTSELIIADSSWTLSSQPIQISYNGFIQVPLITLSQNDQHVRISGQYHAQESYPIRATVDNLQMNTLSTFVPALSDLNGRINGQITATNLNTQPIVDAGLVVQGLTVGRERVGMLMIYTTYDVAKERMALEASLQDENLDRTLEAAGFVMFDETEAIGFEVEMRETKLVVLEPALRGYVSELGGVANASLKIGGTRSDPVVTGQMALDDARMRVDYLGTRYRFTHSFDLTREGVNLTGLVLHDERNNTARLTYGRVQLNAREGVRLNIDVALDNFQVLGTTVRTEELYYGTAYVSGNVSVRGPADNLVMDMTLRTMPDTRFYLPLDGDATYTEADYITFVQSDTFLQTQEKVRVTGLTLNMQLVATPDAVISIIFNMRTDDVLEARGNGNLQMSLNTEGDFTMLGNYSITEGSYRFTIADVLNRRFALRRGGTINWLGDPLNANLNITAAYRVRASLDPLMVTQMQMADPAGGVGGTGTTLGATTPGMGGFHDVDALLRLSGEMMSPDIELDFEILELGTGPHATWVETQVQNIKNDEQELYKQVASLLVFQSFTPVNQGFGSGLGGGSGMGVGSIITSSLNNMLGRLSEDVTVGVDYRATDDPQRRQDELVVRMNASILNDKLRVGGAYDVNSASYNAQVAGNLNEQGTVQGKAFSRANNNPVLDQTSNTVGIGVVFRREFDNFRDIFRRRHALDPQ